ncbi:MAG: PHP domain-containing protein [Verrucomicrobiota bacterium]
MKKILILTARFGDGHNTAACNLREAITLLREDARVEVVDLLAAAYGSIYSLARNTHLKMVQYAPRLWSSIYSFIDNSSVLDRNVGGLNKLRDHLMATLKSTEPDCVVSTYPLYGHVLAQLFTDHCEPPFRFVTVITDSISVNAAWFRAESDYYCVTNERTADVLRQAGVEARRIKALGFPVHPMFALEPAADLPFPGNKEPKRVLYMINSGQKKAGKSIDELLEIPDVRLTITAGRDAWLKAKLLDRTRAFRERVQVLGWTNQMPTLLRSHHLVIGKAGGATVQEAIAACCPMIINQVIPGQEEGNAQLVADLGLGEVVATVSDMRRSVERAFTQQARRWCEWRENLTKVSQPEAALRIAELILDDETPPGRQPAEWHTVTERRPMTSRAQQPGARSEKRMLLCDFHIHTNYSDGKLTLPEVVDFYGELGFDCICITDHIADPNRLIGKMTRLCNFTMGLDQLDEYFEVIARERARAWKKYGMIVLAGLEFNKDGYTKNSSAHLLAIDLHLPIDPSLDLINLIARIQEQQGLAVASHPHLMHSEWGKNTLYLWNHQDEFAPLLDAWEIANRDNIFNPIGLKRLPFLANSDFHKPKHVYSWKTLLYCAKEPEAIKECIRTNRDVAITLFRKSDVRECGRAFGPQWSPETLDEASATDAVPVVTAAFR